MTTENMKYFFTKTKGILDWETFMNCQIKQEDDEETCKKKISRVLTCYDNIDLTRWEYYKAIYDDIPVEYRMNILLENVYQCADIDVPEMLNMMKEYYRYEETEDMKKRRIEKNKQIFKRRIRKDGTIKVFRGVAENLLLPQYSTSFTLHKKIAEFFVRYHKAHHGSRFGVVHSELITLDRVIGFSNARNEAEVFVIPEAVMANQTFTNWGDVECLDAWNIESFDYYDEETYETVQDIISGAYEEAN